MSPPRTIRSWRALVRLLATDPGVSLRRLRAGPFTGAFVLWPSGRDRDVHNASFRAALARGFIAPGIPLEPALVPYYLTDAGRRWAAEHAA